MTDSEIKELLVLIAKNDCCGEFYWHTNLTFFILCNDFFAWACADGTEVKNKEDIDLLRKCFEDAGEIDGALLYCARKAELRPQGAYYAYLEKKNWPLFDACGPKREVGFGNPYEHPTDK